jgi:hypothetical protein
MMMFQGNDLTDASNSASNLSSQLEKASGFIKDMKDPISFLSQRFKDTLDTVGGFENKLITSSRSLGQGAEFAKMMQSELGEAAVNVVEMGGKLGDVLTTFEKIQSTLGRTVFLSQQFYENAFALQRAGVDPKTINSFADFFDTVGGGFQRSTEQQIELVNQAKSYGLNVGQFLSSVGDRLDIINKYGFPNGIKDLSEMVAKSQMLGNTLDTARNLADQIMGSPEKAYEFAAQLQTLGGSFSQLGDGAQLLYMAQNDLAGLNDQIINAARGIATFNQESGQFEISANERLRLKALNNIGLDAKAIEEAALKLAKQEKILSEINLYSAFGEMGDEEKRVLANFAEIGKGGVVTLKGEELKNLDTSEVKQILGVLQGSQSQLSTSTEENIKTQQANMSSMERLSTETNLLQNSFALAAIKTGNFSKSLEEAVSVITGLQSGARDVIKTQSGVATSAIGAPLTKLEGVLENLTGVLNNINPNAVKSVEVINSAPIKITIDSSFDFSDVIKTNLNNFASQIVNDVVEKKVAEAMSSGGYSK